MLHLNVIPALVLSMALVPSGLPLQQDLLTLPPIQTHGRETTSTDKESHDALSLVTDQAQVAGATHLPPNTWLDYPSARRVEIRGAKDSFFIPIQGNFHPGGALPGGVIAVFNASGALTETHQMNLFQDSPNSGHAELYSNGIHVKTIFASDSRLTPDDALTIVKQTGETSHALYGTHFSMDTFKDCLSSAGIASWVINAIAVACTTACVVSLGAGCAACAIGTGLITGGVVGTCVGKALSED
ncbi:hypothetical protein SAMN05660745_02077 [Corynebacterium glucuronolyticum]|nr:hypothetical protein CGLUCO_12490 [Corynebacterium glucuronolyticum DSM 44120]SMB78875.1 hypothetical protein SAMN05660745_02077 [Corynebacterium glucuronolyticum]